MERILDQSTLKQITNFWLPIGDLLFFAAPTRRISRQTEQRCQLEVKSRNGCGYITLYNGSCSVLSPPPLIREGSFDIYSLHCRRRPADKQRRPKTAGGADLAD